MVEPWGKVTVPWSGLPISVYEDLGWWGTVVVEAGLDKHSECVSYARWKTGACTSGQRLEGETVAERMERGTHD